MTRQPLFSPLLYFASIDLLAIMPPSKSTRSIWPGLGLLIMAAAPKTFALADIVEKDWGVTKVHRVVKIHVTTETQLFRRSEASSTCPTNYSLCPKSMSGGCCPTDFACETDSCVQTTIATTVSACGTAGYINCGLEAGGGCCPAGMSSFFFFFTFSKPQMKIFCQVFFVF